MFLIKHISNQDNLCYPYLLVTSPFTFFAHAWHYYLFLHAVFVFVQTCQYSYQKNIRKLRLPSTGIECDNKKTHLACFQCSRTIQQEETTLSPFHVHWPNLSNVTVMANRQLESTAFISPSFHILYSLFWKKEEKN